MEKKKFVLEKDEVFAVKTMKIYFMSWHCCLHYNYNVLFICWWPLKCQPLNIRKLLFFYFLITFLCPLLCWETN